MKNINELPMNIQEEIKNTLKAYDEVTVFYENGTYHFGLCLKSQYADDHEYIGTFKASELYGENERIVNYVESFHEYPIQYKGKRDYRWLKALTWASKVAIDEAGNLVNA